jgi:hypothetical protein
MSKEKSEGPIPEATERITGDDPSRPASPEGRGTEKGKEQPKEFPRSVTEVLRKIDRNEMWLLIDALYDFYGVQKESTPQVPRTDSDPSEEEERQEMSAIDWSGALGRPATTSSSVTTARLTNEPNVATSSSSYTANFRRVLGRCPRSPQLRVRRNFQEEPLPNFQEQHQSAGYPLVLRLHNYL